MGGLFGPNGNDAFREQICAEMALSPQRTALATLEQLLRWDVDSVLETCRAAVYAINADELLDQKSAARLAAKIRIERMPNVGHFLMLENPEGFNETLIKILRVIA